ncbi:MAG: hypothetical protein AAF251_09530 [Pseudomonadota bacterium]
MPTALPDQKRVLLEAAGAFAFVALLLTFMTNEDLPRTYFVMQDRFVAVFAAVILGLLAFQKLRIQRTLSVPTRLQIWVIAAALVVLLWAGNYWVMLDYPVTRDELMARFDAEIFATGRVAMPTQEQWREYTLALIPNFLEPVQGYETWVSSYMPIHAAMRAGVGLLFDPALLNPFLAAVGLMACAAVARQLFPEEAGAQWVVVLGYVLSAQILINAMTSYAMTAHLAFNAVWLWLFLRDRWWSHAGAMAIGALAIGLHQIIFHPLFAGPLLLTLLAKRRFTLFGVYSIVYAGVLLTWIGFHGWATGGAPTTTTGGSGGVEFILRRALPLLLNINPQFVSLTLYNMLRFLAWMPLFLLPLLLLAWPSMKSRDSLALPLAAGLFGTLFAMAWMQAFQGHGWGYRYAHHVLPNALLLAGFGYARCAKENREKAQAFVLAGAGATIPVLIFLAATARSFIAPYAALTERIDRQPTDFVMLETKHPGTAVDQVRNRADLSNTPIILSADHMTFDQVVELCNRGTVTLLEKSDFKLIDFGYPRAINPDYAKSAKWVVEQDCYRVPQP